MTKQKKISMFLILLILSFSSLFYYNYCLPISDNDYAVDEPIISLGVSSDGRYIISVDNKGSVVLWDLEKKSKKLLDKKGNIYTAFFIKETDKFMWQNYETNDVTVQNIHGETVKKFHVEGLSYGHGIGTNLEYYVTLLTNHPILTGCYFFFINLKKDLPLKYLGKDDYLCGGNPNHFDFLSNNKLFRSYDGSALLQINDSANWTDYASDVINVYEGNIGKTFATLSPDGNFVVGGDENMRVYVWETET